MGEAGLFILLMMVAVAMVMAQKIRTWRMTAVVPGCGNTYGGEGEGMPLQLGKTRAVQEDILSRVMMKSLLLHLQLKHVGWMFHHLATEEGNGWCK